METTTGSAPGERIAAARAQAEAEVDRRLGRHALPSFLESLVGTAWQNVLLLTVLRHGRSSERWAEALGCLDDLIWTVQPKRSAADVARLQSMLPDLGRQLREGLLMVAFDEPDVDRLFEELRNHYRERMAERYRETLHMPTARSARPLRRPETLRPVPLAPPPTRRGEASADAGPAAHPEPGEAEHASARARPNSYLRGRIEALKPGAWLEFTAPDGARVRAKLSWVSPISKNYLFVTAQGTKLADMGLDELVAEVSAGHTLLLDSAPVFTTSKDS